jgi:hypothetical protein
LRVILQLEMVKSDSLHFVLQTEKGKSDSLLKVVVDKEQQQK